MNYFPPSPVPDWPKRSQFVGRIIDLVAECRLVPPGEDMNTMRIRLLDGEGFPQFKCISCGSLATPDGDIPCGH